MDGVYWIDVTFYDYFNFYIVIEMSSFKHGVVDLTKEREELEVKIDEDDEAIGLILRQKAISEEIFPITHCLKRV